MSNEIRESVKCYFEIIYKAKIVWSNAFDELNLLDNYATTLADQNLRFQKLVALQQSYDLLKKVLFTHQCF